MDHIFLVNLQFRGFPVDIRTHWLKEWSYDALYNMLMVRMYINMDQGISARHNQFVGLLRVLKTHREALQKTGLPCTAIEDIILTMPDGIYKHQSAVRFELEDNKTVIVAKYGKLETKASPDLSDAQNQKVVSELQLS